MIPFSIGPRCRPTGWFSLISNRPIDNIAHSRRPHRGQNLLVAAAAHSRGSIATARAWPEKNGWGGPPRFLKYQHPEVTLEAPAGQGTGQVSRPRCSCPPALAACSRDHPTDARDFLALGPVGPTRPVVAVARIGLLGLGQLDLHLDDTSTASGQAAGQSRRFSRRWLGGIAGKGRGGTSGPIAPVTPNLADPGSFSRVRHCRHPATRDVQGAVEGPHSAALDIVPLSNP